MILHSFLFFDAVALTSNPLSTNGVVTVCAGVPLSFVCSHDNVAGTVTIWEVSGPNITRCQGPAIHNSNRADSACGPFTITMVSDSSGLTVSSTAQTTVTETLDGAMVECFNGPTNDAASVGVITIQVVDPTPSTDSVTYSVESSVSGSLTINVNSPGAYGTNVTYRYSGSLIDENGSVQVIDNNVLTFTDLDYTQTHTVNITGVCSGMERSSQLSYIFNTTELAISQLTPSIQCSIPSLPVILSWDIDQVILSSTDPNVPLYPPIFGIPIIIINFNSKEKRSNIVTSASPYTLSNPTLGDIYSFTVIITNVAGVTTQITTPVKVSAFSVDARTVASQGCLTFTVNENCAEDISLGGFAILLSYGVGQCQSVADFPNPTIMSAAINSPTGVCIPVETISFVELCYNATLMYQDTAVMSQTNLDFRRCEISTLESQLGSGVTFILSSAPDSNRTVPHTTIATLECGNAALTYSGVSQAPCVDSVWTVGNNSCSVAGWLVFVIVLLVLLLLTAVLLITVTVAYRRVKQMSTPTDCGVHQLGPMYEDPHDGKTDSQTQGLKPPIIVRGPIYEEPDDIKPDPHTEGNVAYGHVHAS